MALMELTWADPNDVSNSNRPFNCDVCLKRNDSIATLRRCREERYDFNESDNASVFPIQINKVGNRFGFCPGKATWDIEAQAIFRILMVAKETNSLYNEGGISNQPYWFMDLLSWFVPIYDSNKFIQRAKMILGDGKENHGSHKRRPENTNKR